MGLRLCSKVKIAPRGFRRLSPILSYRSRLAPEVSRPCQNYETGAEGKVSKEVLRMPLGEKTPNGGVVAEAYFFDDAGNSVEKDRATQMIIRELDSEGNLLWETFGTIERDNHA